MKNRICLVCKKDFLSKWNSKTCSIQCKKRYMNEYGKLRYKMKKRGIWKCKERKVICLYCKKLFITNKNNKKICSMECRKKFFQEIKRLTKVYNKICKICGGKFETIIHNKIYCSEKCKKESSEKKEYKKENKFLDNKKCVICGGIMPIINVRFCSKKCNDIAKSKSKIRTSKNGETAKYLKLRFEIFKRDNFTCQYCGKNVKEDGIKLNIDHINPKSNNGNDKINNLTTSCFECNMGKGDVLLEKRRNYLLWKR